MKLFRLFACGWVMLLFALPASLAATTAEPEHVILLHGLGRTSASMQRIATSLERAGFRVTNLDYPSRRVPLEELARTWLPQQLAVPAITAAPRLHIVTHSMGGIMVRLWLRDRPATAHLGRVVMLAPPNAGSELPLKMRAFPPFGWFTGRNGRLLGTAPTDLPQALGPWRVPGVELGIIAGDRTLNPLFSSWIPGPDDGKVSVASTHLAGEREHLVVHHSHTWLGWHRDTTDQIAGFLREGRFAIRGNPAAPTKSTTDSTDSHGSGRIETRALAGVLSVPIRAIRGRWIERNRAGFYLHLETAQAGNSSVTETVSRRGPCRLQSDLRPAPAFVSRPGR